MYGPTVPAGVSAPRRGFEIDVAALERMIDADRAAGLEPFCVIGNAATINTGATDDLAALADVCRRHELWFHVDGAIGALLALAPRHRDLVRGMELAARSRSTCTSGCTCRSRPRAPSCAAAGRTATPSR